MSFIWRNSNTFHSGPSNVTVITFIFIDIAESEDKNGEANQFEPKPSDYRRTCEKVVEI